MRTIDEILNEIKTIKSVERDADIAKALDVRQSMVTTWRKRGTIPYQTLLEFCKREGYRLEWLLTGEGLQAEKQHVLLSEDRGEYAGEIKKWNSGTDEHGVVKLDVFALAGAGTPKELTEHEPIESLVLPKEFGGVNIIPVKVRGLSMFPTIWDGAIVGVNTAERHVVSGEIFAVWVPYEGAVIKRLFMEMDKVIVRSDNKDHPTWSIPYRELENTNHGDHFIQGMVEWIINRKPPRS